MLWHWDLVEFEYYFFWSPLTQTVRFYARHGDSRIRCAVTRTSLEDLAQSSGPLHPRDLERAFEEHRQTIERIAAEKIRAGHFQGDGTVFHDGSNAPPIERYETNASS